jgi:holliday junction DNA helicase RuvB
MSIEAARRRGEPLDHTLFSAPPGLGKTSLAHIIARELGVNLRVTSGPAIERAGDLAAVVSDLDQGDVLFIDETARRMPCRENSSPRAGGRRDTLSRDGGLRAEHRGGERTRGTQHEARGQAVYNGRSYHPLGPSEFPAARPLRPALSPGFLCQAELTQIIQRSAQLLDVLIDQESAAELGARARGTPRIANRLLRRVRDFAQVNAAPAVSREIALGALELLEIDVCGFDKMDRAILSAIIDKFDGGPVGVDT